MLSRSALLRQADLDDEGEVLVRSSKPPPSSSSFSSSGAATSANASSSSATAKAGPSSDEDGGAELSVGEFVPLRERRAQEEARRRAKRQRLGNDDDAVIGSMDGSQEESNSSSSSASSSSAAGASTLGGASSLSSSSSDAGGGGGAQAARPGESLLDAALRISATSGATALYGSEEDRRRKEEAALLAQISAVQKNSLVTAKELAYGTRYSEPFVTDWRPPRHIREAAAEEHTAIRATHHILVEGKDVPPPIRSFADMRFPTPILEALVAKGIARPTPIQVQGLPVALSGRDMIGVAFTGSGKTMVFVLPAVMAALQEECRMPLANGEGPVAIIMAPARELARQTAELVQLFARALRGGGYPELRVMLAIGGEDLRTQMEATRNGVHIIVATPGRLKEHLIKKRVNLEICRYFVLDEGDRMLDTGFDEEIKEIFSFFPSRKEGDENPHSTRQTVIFSATMPKVIRDFAANALVAPVIVNVSRAGAANLAIIQEVELVKQDARITYLLSCLQKTPPPVIIFAENKRDVDDIVEYLLLKGVSAVSIHGGKTQEDRNAAIDGFKACIKDVLVATDVAAKGLDFPAIQHVINYDMPKEIENYVHRIGRTGRSGKMGVATTFINMTVETGVLLDLKHLLIEAKQRVPPILLALEDPADEMGGGGGEGEEKGCAHCGGLGHRVTACPKLESQRKALAGPKKDFLGKGASDW